MLPMPTMMLRVKLLQSLKENNLIDAKENEF
ncbi:MAG: phosphonate ABC transporter ATP-binding protein [Erysipelotrichaceae bacterium]|nr:MAG: phosphonate ABC transporter ATP-binding protein [Erysipelotrichaceae bacterium]